MDVNADAARKSVADRVDALSRKQSYLDVHNRFPPTDRIEGGMRNPKGKRYVFDCETF